MIPRAESARAMAVTDMILHELPLRMRLLLVVVPPRLLLLLLLPLLPLLPLRLAFRLLLLRRLRLRTAVAVRINLIHHRVELLLGRLQPERCHQLLQLILGDGATLVSAMRKHTREPRVSAHAREGSAAALSRAKAAESEGCTPPCPDLPG